MFLPISDSRKKQIKKTALAALRKMRIETPAVNPKSIVRRLGRIYNFSDPDIKGFTRFINGEYIIYINNVQYKNMSTWTYAHEAGHIILKHFINNKKFLSDDIGCDYLDREANVFAAELLMPEEWIFQYVNQYPPITPANLGKLYSLFNVSWESLLNRLHSLNIQSKKDSILILNGSPVLPDKNEPQEPQHRETKVETTSLNDGDSFNPFEIFKTKTCFICGNSTTNSDAKYCSICGNSSFQYLLGKDWQAEFSDHINTDEHGHAVICPKCGNDKATEDNNCPVCDTYLYQECTNEIHSIDVFGEQEFKFSCGNIPAGNARYCECCGNRTSFYIQGLLLHWQKYIENNVNKQITDEAAATYENT